MRIDPDVLTSNITRFLRDGWQTVGNSTVNLSPSPHLFAQNIHAIGDRANSLVLDAFERALDGINVTALRPRLEHAQIIRHEDMTRLAKLGGKSLLHVLRPCLIPMQSSPVCNQRMREFFVTNMLFLTLRRLIYVDSIDDMYFGEERLVSATAWGTILCCAQASRRVLSG
jgi:hypothetical protein